MYIPFRDTGHDKKSFAPLTSESFVNSRVTLLTGAQNQTVVLNVDRDRVYEAALEGIDVENITIHACSDQDLLVLQATPQELRVIRTLGASASGNSGLLEIWTPSPLLSSDARVTISHVTTAGSKAVIVHHRENQAQLNVLNWGLTGISSICGASISQQQVRILLVYRRMELSHPSSSLRSGFSAAFPEDSSFPSPSCRFLQSLLGFRNAMLGHCTLL